MKTLPAIFGLLLFSGLYFSAHADEDAAVRSVQSKLVRISQEPRLSNHSEARSILDQKLADLQAVDGQIDSLLHVVMNPALRRALTSAQSILQRISRTPTNDPTWTIIYLGEVIKLAGQAADVLNVRADQSSCDEDVLSNPLRGDTL